ncbi:hypothetical protein LTR37_009358 [Vermiconidia calcicola]|uniref:Uncharacterized protein n=1 Tax=Vermiconidia calcicola TaxID=1690605 RepID=A0ACC3N940_9PEZI|nr:hypothetical protein LTR37_009358 [Vermiconidia calcicola]
MPPMAMHPDPRRRQDYQPYHHPAQPQSPLHHPYAGYPHPAQYYPHQPGPPPQYAPQRWQHPYATPQPYMPPPPPQPQQVPYQPRSPMVVTSQPYPQAMTPGTRQTPIPPPQQQMIQPVSHSPRPVPQNVPAHVHTPVAPPSPAPTPKQEEQVQIVPKLEATSPPQAPARRESVATNPLSLAPEHKMPFYPELPWYSTAEGASTFPRRTAGRRKRRQNLDNIDSVALPSRGNVEEEVQEQAAEEQSSETSTIAAPSEPETPATSQAPSESDYTQASAPATPAQAAVTSPKSTPIQTQSQHVRRDTRTAIAVPNLPSFNKSKASPAAASDKQEAASTQPESATSQTEGEKSGQTEEQTSTEAATPATPPAKPAPKSWADLVRRNTTTSSAGGNANDAVTMNGIPLPKSAPLADALKQYSVQNDAKLSFLEPRGLVNTGNMCYMNSMLQVLVFCSPFYTFLDQVRQRTVHSMKSDTPLIDAMIMFMREFKVLADAESVDILRSLLKQQQLEQYGDPVTPQYVYDAIAKLDRFNTMRRGQQQDAEEFLGFLLEGLHDECVTVMRGQTEEQSVDNGVTSPSAVMSPTSADGWLEVGPKQKASVTRTAGTQDAPSPVTKIFGGHLRSVLRVPGMKDSVTLEPYKPLQLDIGAPHVNNIVDALKSITHTEALTGDFGGKTNSAKKQVFIDTLPPVLILHLKRFQFENKASGTQKIWKKVGYPLELEIPKEVFPPQNRGGLAVKGGLPKYRLISVVYHHGKLAAGGHYTVDVRREDGREWVRMDDTIIRRIRPEDVAEGGSEEDPKLLAKALEQHKADQELQKQRNMYQGLDEADKEPEVEKPWSEVNGHVPGHKKGYSVANTNGTATPVSTSGKKTPTARKEGVRDSKVAYILLYERIRA